MCLFTGIFAQRTTKSASAQEGWALLEYTNKNISVCVYVRLTSCKKKGGVFLCAYAWMYKAEKKVCEVNRDGVMSVNCPFCFFLTVLLSRLCLVTESCAFG